MKTRHPTRDRREDRCEREEKLGQAAETLPGKTLRDRFSRKGGNSRFEPHRSPGIEVQVGEMARPKATPREWSETVIFELDAPDAEFVCLAGTFNDWQPQNVSLSKGSDGRWSVALPLAPGAYEYRFIVDGVWQEDPDAIDSAPNPFGGRNSIIQIT